LFHKETVAGRANWGEEKKEKLGKKKLERHKTVERKGGLGGQWKFGCRRLSVKRETRKMRRAHGIGFGVTASSI